MYLTSSRHSRACIYNQNRWFRLISVTLPLRTVNSDTIVYFIRCAVTCDKYHTLTLMRLFSRFTENGKSWDTFCPLFGNRPRPCDNQRLGSATTGLTLNPTFLVAGLPGALRHNATVPATSAPPQDYKSLTRNVWAFSLWPGRGRAAHWICTMSHDLILHAGFGPRLHYSASNQRCLFWIHKGWWDCCGTVASRQKLEF